VKSAALAAVAWVALLAPPCAPAAAEDAETKPYSSADGRVTITLPAAWTLEAVKVDRAAMAWQGFLPDEAGPVEVIVYHLPGMMNPRAQPFLEREIHPQDFGVKEPAHTETDVLPHIWIDEPVQGGPAMHHVWMYRVVKRNGFTTVVHCRTDAWPAVREQCLRAGSSLTTTMDEWPSPPTGYKRRVRDGIVYYVHAAAGDSDAAVHAFVRAEQLAFAKLHGAPPPSPESPMVVVVHQKAADAAKLSSEAASAPSGECFDGATFRLFAVAPAKADTQARAYLAREARQLVYSHAMGGTRPAWLYFGEGALVWNEEVAGKPPPTIASPLKVLTVRRFDVIAESETAAGDNYETMFVYAALFRYGPRVYRDAFAAFLKDAAATGDVMTAQKTRLLSLDQEKLWEAANAFLKELKVAKPR
jgi:hypothetical protein